MKILEHKLLDAHFFMEVSQHQMSVGVDLTQREIRLLLDALGRESDLLDALKVANAFLVWLAQEGKCGDLVGWGDAQQAISAAIAKAEEGTS